MTDRLPIDSSHSREILYEVMEELMLIGMIDRCAAIDGQEMTQKEISKIYALAKGIELS